MLNTPFERRRFLAGACGCCAGFAAPLSAPSAQASVDAAGEPDLLELAMEGMQRLSATVWIGQIAPGLWVHTTTAIIPGGYYYPANGLIVETQDSAILIDTGYEPEQTHVLLDWADRTLANPVAMAVGTHFHNDSIGGVAALEARELPLVISVLTQEQARSRDLLLPTRLLSPDQMPESLQADCQLYYPGGGHTIDNIVAWLPRQKTLFGGCLLKSETSKSLGNLTDAVVGEYKASVERLSATFPGTEIAVPGHGTLRGNAIARTLTLIEAQL